MVSEPAYSGDFSRAVMFMEILATSMEATFLTLPTMPSNIRQIERAWLDSFNSAISKAKQAANQNDTGTVRQGVLEVRRILSW